MKRNGRKIDQLYFVRLARTTRPEVKDLSEANASRRQGSAASKLGSAGGM